MAARKLHLEFGNSWYGYDIPAAIGVRLAGAEKEVYVLMGDGNYSDASHGAGHCHAGEDKNYDTIERELRLTIHPWTSKALVGHSLGNEFKIRDQESGLLDEGQFIEVDYAKNAESVGLKTWVANTEAEIRSALQEKHQENSA